MATTLRISSEGRGIQRDLVEAWGGALPDNPSEHFVYVMSKLDPFMREAYIGLDQIIRLLPIL